MPDTKLILIEGLPGAGKSTTAESLGKTLQQHGTACRWFLEDSDPHPLPCLDYAIRDLPQTLVPLWRTFAGQAVREPWVTILESRLWQNTALFMYMSEYPVEAILDLSQKVYLTLASLRPVLIYLDQPNTAAAFRRLYALRGEQALERELQATLSYPWFTTRGLTDFAGWVQFFEAWAPVAERLYRDWPYAKLKMINPHNDWASATQQMLGFILRMVNQL